MDSAIALLGSLMRHLVPDVPFWPTMIGAIVVIGLIETGVVARVVFRFEERVR